MTAKRYMKTREAANYLGLAENTLAKNRAGLADIPYIRVGGAIRYDKEALDDYMKAKGIHHGNDKKGRKRIKGNRGGVCGVGTKS